MTNEQLACLVVELSIPNPHYTAVYEEVLERINERTQPKAVVESKEPFYVEKPASSTKATKGK